MGPILSFPFRNFGTLHNGTRTAACLFLLPLCSGARALANSSRRIASLPMTLSFMATNAKTLLGMMPNRVVNALALAGSNIATTRRRELRLVALNYEESDL